VPEAPSPLDEGVGGCAVLGGEVLPRGHGVDQVEGAIHAFGDPRQGAGAEEVSLHHLHRPGPLAPRDPGRIPHQHPDLVAPAQQASHEAPSDVAGGAGEEDCAVGKKRWFGGHSWRVTEGRGRHHCDCSGVRNVTAYGAELVLTPREVGMIAKAEELKAEIGDAWIPQQFENPANPKIHETITAQEILEDFPEGLDYVITGVGTGGHLTGVSRVLKPKMPGLRTFAVESAKSALIGGGTHSPHKIQGISAGFVPANLDRGAIDGAIAVTEEDAFRFAQRAAKEEGLFA
jgi:hypothetical protein